MPVHVRNSVITISYNEEMHNKKREDSCEQVTRTKSVNHGFKKNQEVRHRGFPHGFPRGISAKELL